MAGQYNRGQHPRSLANLGKPKTKAGRFNFTLTEASTEWLSRQSNKSAAIDQLIAEQAWRERMNSLPVGITGKSNYEVINSDLGQRPDVEQYERTNGVTHYDFKVSQDRNGSYRVKARPYLNWKERMEADMEAMGL
jgi:predicted dienelactone hydrolase